MAEVGTVPVGIDPALEKDLHTVIVLEALPTSKYVYVRVKEGEEEFWIATTLQEITIGRSYFYRGGLLKTNFESKEYKRTFDRLYLISQLIPSDHGSTMDGTGAPVVAVPSNANPLPALDVPGMTKIADLIANPKKFDGKTIQVSGKCTKVNPNIMGRNWIHLREAGKESRGHHGCPDHRRTGRGRDGYRRTRKGLRLGLPVRYPDRRGAVGQVDDRLENTHRSEFEEFLDV